MRTFLLSLLCLCTVPTFAYFFEEQFAAIAEDKYYLKPGTLFVAPEGLYLCCDGVMLPVTDVSCDTQGVFVRPYAFKWPRCASCNWPILPSGVCSNPLCPTKT